MRKTSHPSAWMWGAVVIGTLLVGQRPARADFANGSFETGSFTFDGNGADSLQPGSTVISGWTTMGAELAVIENANNFGLSTPYGTNFLDLTGYHDGSPYGGVQQSLTTAIGQSYEVSLYLGVNNSRADSSAPISVQITAGAVSGTLTADPTGTGMIWTLETFSFTAASTSTLVTIQGLSTSNGHFIGLDNVSASGVSVPEPMSLLQLGLGAAGAVGLLGRRARRRHAA